MDDGSHINYKLRFSLAVWRALRAYSVVPLNGFCDLPCSCGSSNFIELTQINASVFYA